MNTRHGIPLRYRPRCPDRFSTRKKMRKRIQEFNNAGSAQLPIAVAAEPDRNR